MAGLDKWTSGTAALLAMVACGPLQTPAESSPLENPEEKEKRIDGVYFLPAPMGTGRVLEFSNGSFFLTYHEGKRLSQLSGHYSYDCDPGTVWMGYFNGEKVIQSRFTYAIIDGKLWLGVFRKEATEDRWRMCSQDTGILGPAGETMASCEITWDMAHGMWVHHSYATPGRRVTVQEGVRTVSYPDPDHPDPAFLAVFPSDGSPETLIRHVFPDREGLRYTRPFPRFTLTHLGLFADRAWTLEKEAAEASTAGGAQGLFRALVRHADEYARNPSRSHVARKLELGCHYTRKGDILLTPWSAELGPVGLIPVLLDEESALGEWRGEVNATRTFSINKRDDLLHPALDELLQLHRPPTHRDEEGPREGIHGPDPRGISHTSWGWSCGMNHGDHPGNMYWFAMKKDLLTRYTYPALCDGGGAANIITGRLERFVKSR